MKRFIQTLQQECLDDFVVFGETHVDNLVTEMPAQYHEERPHQGKENDPLNRAPSKQKARKKSETPPEVMRIGDISCRERQGGSLKHFGRNTAWHVSCSCDHHHVEATPSRVRQLSGR